MYRIATIVSALMLLSAGLAAYGQESYLGGYNSPKGIGLSLKTLGGEHCDNIQLFAEIYGIPTGRANIPGIKASYSRGVVFKVIDGGNEGSMHFYAGPGASAGFLRDYEKGYYSDKDMVLSRNFGAMFAVNGTVGCLFRFAGNISIDVFWTAEAGIHIRKGETDGAPRLSFYKNGIYQAFYPQISLLLRF